MNDRGGRGPAPLATRALAAALVVVSLLASAVAACGGPTPTIAPREVATAPPTSPATVSSALPADSAAPTAADTGGSGAPVCDPAELKASHGIVEGAAGSVLTEVVLVAAATCAVDAFPALGLRDANGTQLVGAGSTGPGRIDLVASVAYTSQVRLANWCAPEPAFPVQLFVRIGSDELAVTGDDPFPDEGDLPPCEGEIGPILESTEWAPTP